MRAHLALAETTDNAKLALQADKIVEIVQPSLVEVYAINNKSHGRSEPPATRDIANDKSDGQNDLSVMKDAINALTRNFEALRNQIKGLGGARPRSRSRYREENNNNDSLCYYPAKFGEKARKCRQPCTKYDPGHNDQYANVSAIESVHDANELNEQRLYVYDRTNGNKFLIDSG